MPGSALVTMFNKKANTGPLAPPMGFDIRFADDRVLISPADTEPPTDGDPVAPLWVRMRAELQSGARPLKDLAAVLGAPEGSVRRALTRDGGRNFAKVEQSGATYKVGLAARVR